MIMKLTFILNLELNYYYKDESMFPGPIRHQIVFKTTRKLSD